MAGGEEAFKRKPNYLLYSEPISPLISDFHALDKLIYCAEHGIPNEYSPCAIGGATVPATHAGQIVVAMSESLVGVILSQLINPGSCIILGGVQSILDMMMSTYSYGAPELSVLCGGMTEVAKYLNLPMFGTSGCTDTKVMEMQSGVEAALSIHSAMLTGANFVHDNGYTESGKTGDIFQTVLDDEIIGMGRVLEQGITVNEETLALDIMRKVGPSGHYLYEDHTMKWFRSHWRPTIMNRQSWEDWESSGKTSTQERIIQKTRDIIENYEGPISRVPKDVKRDIDLVIEGAKRRVEKEGL